MLVRLSIIGAVSAILMLATMLSAQELEALLTPALPYLVPLFKDPDPSGSRSFEFVE